MTNMEPRKPFIIGVSGGPTSGKVITISMESFYRELSDEERALAEKGEYDFDHPTAFDFDRLADTITKLEQGFSVTIPRYDYLISSSDGVLKLEPADVIIVEGILAFYDERIRRKFTMKLFVDADADVRLARRGKYALQVKPAFEEFCQPTMKYADVIIPRAGENDVAIDLITNPRPWIFRMVLISIEPDFDII
ncbi:unnamed protein product [Heligmosomoides polygyrus]|uniref:uridine/cytidine kinase n=1 Tax=Heligmosomoides polygyrus TaxID=6339 RepID=A0A3P8AHH8_HELPZ|nr:unnamed protein product [Heligmosomoides polygyrus]